MRHFGEQPLDENDDIQSDPSTVVNLIAGREWDELALRLEVFNLLDSDDHDIDYWYEAQLAGGRPALSRDGAEDCASCGGMALVGGG